MGDQNEVDYNDAMFEVNDERPQQQLASVSNDSDRGSSLSNFGIDRDNPEEIHQYILQHQDRQAVIQGIGVVVGYPSPSTSVRDDSGRATSISKTTNSELIPEIIEYPRENPSDTNSELEIDEPQPGTSSGERYGYDPKYNESEKLAESLQEMSTFDLALAKGYRQQAKISYDDATSKGAQVKTRYVQKLQEFNLTEDLTDETLLQEDFWQKDYVLQRIFMLRKDFEEYLKHLEENQHKNILKILDYKKDLNKLEKQIKKNIKTKENRNNYTLRQHTLILVHDYIKNLENLEIWVKQTEYDKSQAIEAVSESTSCHIENGHNLTKETEKEKHKDDNFSDENRSTGSSQSLSK